MPKARIIGPALVAWRKTYRLTEVEAAHRLGVPLVNYKQWEGGQPCSFPSLVENAIGVPVARPLTSPTGKRNYLQ